jgi:hypothetical protein
MNVVHNDFTDPEAIFKPFFKAGEEYAATVGGVNGVVTKCVNGITTNGVNGVTTNGVNGTNGTNGH